MSAVCKLFYYLSQNNAGFVEKLSHSRMRFSGFDIYGRHRDACLYLAEQLSQALNKDFKEDVFLKAKEIIMGRLIFSILPFRVWNHLFFFVVEASIVLIFACYVREFASVIEPFLII